MDPLERLALRVDELEVAEILHRIATTPNRRKEPTTGDVQGCFDFWFDGAAGKYETGYAEYQFANGARAVVGDPVPALSVTITLANGSRVRVQQESWGHEEAG